MDANESTEVRAIIHDILSGWHGETVLREVTTNKSLDNIDKHLTQLNSKVAIHEKEIGLLTLAGVKHIVECPAMPKIEEVKDSVQKVKDDLGEYKFFKKHPILGVAIIAAGVILMLFNAYDFLNKGVIKRDLKSIEIVNRQDQKQIVNEYKNLILSIDSLKKELK